MIDFLVSLVLLYNVEVGKCAYYADGVMAQTVSIRQAGWTANPLPAELPPVQDFIATPY